MNSYINTAPCFYFSCTDDGKLIDINDTACKILEYTRQELLGKKLDLISTIATRIFYQTHFFPLLKMQRHAEEIFISLQTKNKEEIPVLLNAERIIVNDEALLVHTGIVVRNRKKFEDELIAAKRSAEAALKENTELMQAKFQLQKNMEQLDVQMQLVHEQNEELKQFNRVVSHDLQEPLRKLSVFANLFLDNPEKKDQRFIAEKIINSSQKISSLLSGLQQYVWLNETPLNPKQINLNQLLPRVKQNLETTFPSIEFELHEIDPPVIYADEEQMKLLLFNLLSNAIRFRKPGNKACIHISADVAQRNKFQNIAGKYEYADFLKLQVKDEGVGFDPQYTQQAFELFRRLHAESGLGIGLSLCKKITENHHGHITMDTTENKGTIVTVWLPLQQ